MPVIAVVNRKGGCGKSTLATHLAAHFANAGMSVMLGDVDPQQSAKTWLKLRAQHLPPEKHNILGWVVEANRGMRPPVGTSHIVLDTPGGMTGFELARVALYADVIVMPVCHSAFDRDSATRCLTELMTLPRVASGRCKVAAVAMRARPGSRAALELQAWADGLGLPMVAAINDSQVYVECIETGRSLFDLPGSSAQSHLRQWAPLLAWLEPHVRTPVTPSPREASAPGAPMMDAASASAATAATPQPAARRWEPSAAAGVAARSAGHRSGSTSGWWPRAAPKPVKQWLGWLSRGAGPMR